VTDISLLILSIGISSALLFFSASYTYRVFSEIKIRKSALERGSDHQHHHHVDHDKLTQKLEKYQSETFGRSMIHPSERTRMIAARIREELKGGSGNAH